MKKRLLILAVLAVFAFTGCGGSSTADTAATPTPSISSGGLSGVTASGSKITGDFTPSLSASLSDTKNLKFTVGGIDVDGDSVIDKPTITGVKVTSGDSLGLGKTLSTKAISDLDIDCDDGRDVGAGSTDKYDIGFSMDTTASMGAAVEAIADKIVVFADTLKANGIDVQFSAVTLGDAFATKATSSSLFTDDISEGPLGASPTFDYCERPSTGSALLTAEDLQIFFDEVKSVYPSGCAGSGGTENYLGSLQYLYETPTWRADAAKILISIGDNCAYTPDSYSWDSIIAPWIPSAPADAEAAVAGNVTIHVIGPDESASGCGTSLYDMKGLADVTGGSFTEFDCYSTSTCNVDLDALPITSAITSSKVYECSGDPDTYEGAGSYTFTITLTVVGSGGTTYEAEVSMLLDIAFL